MSEDTLNYNYMELYAGMQVNKVNELLIVGTGLMKIYQERKLISMMPRPTS